MKKIAIARGDRVLPSGATFITGSLMPLNLA
jgi:hypothetical protein